MRIKHDKKGKENTIGKIIYGFLLFMPLLAIGVTCAYAIFNKNAYQSYYGDTINEQIVVNNNTHNLVDNRTYFVDAGSTITGNVDVTFEIENAKIGNTPYPTANRIQFYISNDALSFRYKTGNTNIDWWPISQQSPTFDYLRTISINVNNNDFWTILKYYDYTKDSFISNVFYYSIEEVQQSPLFNWAYDTATYNVLQSTCNSLGITTLFVPMLLSYWLMISLMYLLYDIALLIVHMAHNRIHDIESSI